MRRILLIFAIVLTPISLSFAEDLTITTYYPAPYGVYEELKVQREWDGNTLNANQTLVELNSDKHAVIKLSPGTRRDDTSIVGGGHPWAVLAGNADQSIPNTDLDRFGVFTYEGPNYPGFGGGPLEVFSISRVQLEYPGHPNADAYSLYMRGPVVTGGDVTMKADPYVGGIYSETYLNYDDDVDIRFLPRPQAGQNVGENGSDIIASGGGDLVLENIAAGKQVLVKNYGSDPGQGYLDGAARFRVDGPSFFDQDICIKGYVAPTTHGQAFTKPPDCWMGTDEDVDIRMMPQSGPAHESNIVAGNDGDLALETVASGGRVQVRSYDGGPSIVPGAATLFVDGNVGIGVSDPISRLSVGGAGDANYSMYVLNTAAPAGVAIFAQNSSSANAIQAENAGNGSGVFGKSTNPDGFGVVGGGKYGIWGEQYNLTTQDGQGAGVTGRSWVNNAANPGVGVRGWCGSSNPNCYAGYFEGKIAAKMQNVNSGAQARWSTNGPAGSFAQLGFDVAELFDANEEVAPGDILSIDENGKLKKCDIAYDTKIAGVVSEAPAILFEGSQLQIAPTPFEFQSGKKPPVALVGRVRCNATTLDGGAIKVGDLMVSSNKSGYAMKADPANLGFGMILGKALEPLEKGEGKIMVLVNLQ